MYGAILGDIIGSIYEWHNIKSEDFELFTSESRFTDDTVLSVATADMLLHCNETYDRRKSYAMWYKQYYSRYPYAGYGQMFTDWAKEDASSIQHSYGNGGAMRVTAIGYAFDTIEEVLNEVKLSCYYTHHHKEAIQGAQAVASAVFMAHHNKSKEEIRHYLEKKRFAKLNFTLDEIRPNYVFNSRTSYSVPPAIVAFLESNSYEDAIRKAISIGGDSDTIACMAGGIAEAYYKEIPEELLNRGKSFLDMGLKNTVNEFIMKYNINK